jgi:two-component system, NarL family, invasion response regulator UvrY
MNQQITAMIVDDDPIMRAMLRVVLSSIQNVVVVGEAISGEHAIRLATQLMPKLVLMDIDMGGITGIEATEKILSDHPGTTVVGISSHNELHYIVQMFRAGVKGYVPKGSSVKKISKTINTVMQGRMHIELQSLVIPVLQERYCS